MRCPIDEGTKKKEERAKRREKSGEWVLCVTWTPHQHLTVLLTLFDYLKQFESQQG